MPSQPGNIVGLFYTPSDSHGGHVTQVTFVLQLDTVYIASNTDDKAKGCKRNITVVANSSRSLQLC